MEGQRQQPDGDARGRSGQAGHICAIAHLAEGQFQPPAFPPPIAIVPVLLSTIPPEKSATFQGYNMRLMGASGYPRKVRNSLESCRSCFGPRPFSSLKHDYRKKSATFRVALCPPPRRRVGIEQPVQMDDEIAHLRIVDGLLRLAPPSRIGGGVGKTPTISSLSRSLNSVASSRSSSPPNTRWSNCLGLESPVIDGPLSRPVAGPQRNGASDEHGRVLVPAHTRKPNSCCAPKQPRDVAFVSKTKPYR
jgi:hypothetical protein